MASHNELGRIGEAMGKAFLEDEGYHILHLNWKHSYYEIDIIATKQDTLHFIEVKTRRSNRFGFPEESVDDRKLKKIMVAAEAFMNRFPQWVRVQYDVLSVSIGSNNLPQFLLIEDVYL
jgi:putative endonuclease